MNIRNQDRFPDATFWDEDDYKQLGWLEDAAISQIGEEAGQPIVAKNVRSTASLFAIPLWELLNHSQAALTAKPKS